ncbi:MAG: SDR family oxidoreductase [Thermotogaceae bacterium]|nr:SDR family oxidoreductase [Thermotogaceae bacterium]
MNNILVTGGAGFIGSNLVEKLIEMGEGVVVVDNLSTGKVENLSHGALFYEHDITDVEMLKRIFLLHKPRYVFHLAAQASVSKSVREPDFDAKVNIIGTLNLLKLSVEYGVEKFIFSSTGGAIYGDEVFRVPTPETEFPKPISPYGIAKFSVENYLRFFNHEFGLRYTILRYGNVYGPKQDPYGEAGVVAIFTERMLRNEEVKIFGDGEYVRDYVFVEDVVEANIAAMDRADGEIVNIGTSRGTTVNELFRMLKEITGYKKDPVYAPPRPGDLRKSILDISKAEKVLGWTPKINLEEGLKRTVEWFKKKLEE